MTLNFSLMKIGLTKITFSNSIHMGQMKKTYGSNNDIILKFWRLKLNTEQFIFSHGIIYFFLLSEPYVPTLCILSLPSQ